jgi:hypothetical protein
VTGEDGYEAKDFAFIYNKHNRRLRLHLPGSIKMVDHPWLWHGVLTRMVVLGDRPRIVASRDRITTVEGGGWRLKQALVTAFIYNINSKYDPCSDLDQYS